MKLPCKKCISLAMCKPKYRYLKEREYKDLKTNIEKKDFAAYILSKSCVILEDYLYPYSNNEDDLIIIDRIFKHYPKLSHWLFHRLMNKGIKK